VDPGVYVGVYLPLSPHRENQGVHVDGLSIVSRGSMCLVIQSILHTSLSVICHCTTAREAMLVSSVILSHSLKLISFYYLTH